MAALVVLGFLLRTMNAGEVFVGDAVVFPGNDPYYQAHRVFQALAAYPWVPLVDPLLDHPFGAAPIWPPLFPWLLASVAKLLGLSAADPHSVETLLAVSTPLLGALLCIPVYGLGRRLLDGPGAWLAAVLAVLIPAHVWYSRLGFVDHHAAVTLVQVSMFLAALIAVRGGSVVWLTATLALGMALWNGFVLFVAILDAYLAVLFVLEDERGKARVAATVLWSHGLSAVLLVPFAVATSQATGAPWGAFALSYLHVAALGGAASLAACVRVSPARAWVWLAVAIALGLGVGAASGGLSEVASWVFARDAFMSSIQETVPIFLRSDGSLDLAGATVWLTRFWFIVPVLLLLVARDVRSPSRVDAGRLLLVVWGTALFVLTLRQRRFAEAFAPALAILVAFGLRGLQAWVLDAIERRGAGKPIARAAAAAGTCGLVLVGLGPYYEPILRDPAGLLALAHASGEPGGRRTVPASHRNLARLGALASQDRDRGGVMNLWPLGHRVLYLTNLPVVASPFGSHVGGESFAQATAFFLSTDEEAALSILDDRGLRYVVVDNDLGTVGAAVLARGESTAPYYRKSRLPSGDRRIEYQPALYRSLYGRLALLAGTALEGVAAPLHHFRLIVDAEQDHHPGNPKIFERVEGARLRLRAAPDEAYELSYEFVSDAGRTRRLDLRVDTDASGRGEIALPYSSERPDLGQTGAWRLRGRATDLDVFVPEDAVRGGHVVSVELGRQDLF